MTPPIGILGGTFNPVHFGHLRLTQEVAEHLGLAEVRFIPGGTPPHRATPATSAADRAAMVKLAIADNPLLSVDECELHRSGPSYTFDTLSALRSELGDKQPLVLITGADAFAGFATWHRWNEIFDLAHVAVAHRPGVRIEDWQHTLPAALLKEFTARKTGSADIRQTPAGKIAVVPITALDISSTAVRDALRAGRSPRYLLPDAVIEYIKHKYLFL